MKRLALALLVMMLTVLVFVPFTATASSQEENITVENGVVEGMDGEITDNENMNVSDESGVVSLNGKTIMVIGNSMVYYGNCVIFGGQGEEDKGYLYELICSNDETAKVIDHTYSGKTLAYIYENYLQYLSAEELNSVDYVVMSEGTKSNENLASDCEKIMDLFTDKTHFSFMCHPVMYDRNTESLLGSIPALREMGIEIVNWGKMVYDIYSGAVQVPGATLEYDRCTFIKDNIGYANGTGATGGSSVGDDKHPNPLSGYIAAQMLYTSITHRSAVYSDYNFCGDESKHKFFNFDTFISAHYNGEKTTNFDKVFDSAQDMIGIQTLINDYVEQEGRHCLVLDAGFAPGCVTSGLTDGYHCQVCGEVVLEQKIIQSLGGHKEVYDEAVEPVCLNTGKTSGAHCSECGVILIPQRVLDAPGHIPETTVIPASVSAEGKKITSCAVCGEVLATSKIYQIGSINLSATRYAYNGEQKSPSVTVFDNQGNKLKKGRDYTVSYLQSERKIIGTYQVQVTFKGEYEGTQTLSFTIVPKKPRNIEVTQTTSTVTLTWDKTDGATGYTVYKYYPTTGEYKKYKSTKKTTMTVKKLKSGTKYYYVVRAFTKIDTTYLWSVYSDTVSTSTKPKKPSGVKVTSKSKTATVSWDKVKGATGYVVYMSTSENGTYKKIAAVSSKKTSYTKKKLKKGKTYYFKVRAYTKNEKKVYGSYSKVRSVKI